MDVTEFVIERILPEGRIFAPWNIDHILSDMIPDYLPPYTLFIHLLRADSSIKIRCVATRLKENVLMIIEIPPFHNFSIQDIISLIQSSPSPIRMAIMIARDKRLSWEISRSLVGEVDLPPGTVFLS